MTMVWIVIGALVVLQLATAVLLFKTKTKLHNGLFLERDGERLLFKDYQGNIISEKIKIEIQ